MTPQMIFDIEPDELGIFLDEVNEHLQAMESGILELEEVTDPDTVNRVFRAAHTIKALAGTVGHHKMQELTHTMETIFDAMRQEKLVSNPEISDQLLSTLDLLQLFRDEIVNQEMSDLDISEQLAGLRAILDNTGVSAPAVSATPAKSNGNRTAQSITVTLSEAEQAAAAKQLQAGKKLYAAVATVKKDGFAPAARLAQAAMAMMDAGEVIHQKPTMDDLAEAKHDFKIEFVVATTGEKDAVSALLADVIDLDTYAVEAFVPEGVTVTPAATPEPEKTPEPKPKAKPKAKPKVKPKSGGVSHPDLAIEKTVRIGVERLDALMNLVGELVTDRNRLLQIESALLNAHGKDGPITDLTEMNGHLGRVVDQLQEEVMHARMLPIGNTFNKMPRLVRDVSRAAGKQVSLVIEGEDTELDRSLIEFIGDPIIHLLRNSVDHGIEPPDVREKLGKNPTGTVMLTATHEEGHIVITVKDDGAGIDPEKVKAAGVRRGLLTKDEAAQLDDEEAVDLIFRPNLSTAEKVTDISGRGVGMDVVRANIERLSGSVIVTSKVGEGTTFRITLPLTLAIVQTMLVSMHNIAYAIPLSTIIESLYYADVSVTSVKGSQVIHWRDSVLPLIDLREFFIHPRMNGAHQTDSDKTAIVTVAWGKQRAGLVVDKILGKQDIVVKSLNPVMGELPGISGGTILGDGSIALIIDIPGLIGAAMQARRQGATV